MNTPTRKENRNKRNDSGQKISDTISESFILQPDKIDTISSYISDILLDFKVDRATVIKVRLIIEDMMESILNSTDSSVECRFSFRRRFRRGVVQLQYNGLPFNPLEQNTDELTEILLNSSGIPTKWSYQNNTNTISFHVKKQIRIGTLPILIAIGSAVLLGLCCRSLPEIIIEPISSYLLQPFKNAFLGLLNALACLLVFFNIIAGLCGDKKTKPLGKESQQMLLRLPMIVVLITILSYLLLFPFSDIAFSLQQISAESQASQVVNLLWGIIPNNIVLPFEEGNYIQIVILALIFGMALSAVKDQHQELVSTISSLNSITLTVTEKFCSLIPLFVFCCLLNSLLFPINDDLVSDIWKPVVMFVISGIVITVIIFTALSIRLKCNSRKILKAILPAFLIALSTGSPVASYSTNLDILEKRFGVSKKFSGVGLAISGKLYGPGIVLYLAVMVVYFAEKYQTLVNVGWIVTAIIFTVLLTFACPPIPGSFLIIFGVIAKQLGFPDECLVVLAAADIVLDGLSSGLCCILRNAELLFEAADYNELDRSALTNL